MSHRKEENLDYDYLNSGVSDQSSGYVYYSSEPTYHSFSAEPVAPYQQHYSNYPNPFQNAKPDYQYSPVQRNMFSSESYESGAKGYSRTYSGNDLLAADASSSSSSAPGRCLKRYNSDIPSYCEFGTYNPFQGSPLEIANLSLLENRTVEEQLPVTNVSEPVYETEIVPEEAVVPPEAVQNKRSYKDVLTFPHRSESPSNSELNKGKSEGEVRKETSKDGISFPLRSDSPSGSEATGKSKVENEIRKETYKDKLLSPKLETSTPASKAPPVKSNLNNSRSQINTNPKRPLKINNNLAAGNHISSNKTNGKSPNDKNYSLNDSVRSVRSQTDLGGISRKKGGPSLIDNTSFELPPSDDDYVPSPIEIRPNRSDLRRPEKGKSKIREKESNERSSTRARHQKKNQPTRKSVVWIRAYFSKIVNLCGWFCIWLYNLCADVFRMSCDLSWVGLQHCRTAFWEKGFLVTDWLKIQTKKGRHYFTTQWLPKIREFLRYFRRGSAAQDNSASGGLNANIPLPSTGEEAMHRLLACKGRDPYSILGVRRDCSDEEIRRYYKRQAVLVHPDKNRQRGAEEAFKILAHAFELIGQPERRSHYDQLVQEADEMESAWAELNELLSRLHAKMDEEANTIRCTNCAKRHRRVKTDRPCYAARYCQDCKIHHSAREGDLWAESRFPMGFRSNYYACMEGAVYDITEWANCQAGHLRHLQSNSHRVQYRIVPGQGQSQQNHGSGRKLS